MNNPTEEQVTSVITEYERQQVLAECSKIDQEIELWREYCRKHKIIPFPVASKPAQKEQYGWLWMLLAGALVVAGLLYAAVTN